MRTEAVHYFAVKVQLLLQACPAGQLAPARPACQLVTVCLRHSNIPSKLVVFPNCFQNIPISQAKILDISRMSTGWEWESSSGRSSDCAATRHRDTILPTLGLPELAGTAETFWLAS